MTDAGGTKPRPLMQTQFEESEQEPAPDGKFLAYTSDETGKREIFVRPLDATQTRRQVSSRGGRFATWHPRGTELYFMEGTTLMAASVRPGSLEVGVPHPLFTLEPLAADTLMYAPADGQRFVVVRTLTPPQNSVAVVQNWLREFQK